MYFQTCLQGAHYAHDAIRSIVSSDQTIPFLSTSVELNAKVFITRLDILIAPGEIKVLLEGFSFV